MASPELSAEELEIQAGAKGSKDSLDQSSANVDLSKKGALGIISLNLQAFTLQPKLSIDRKLKMDG